MTYSLDLDTMTVEFASRANTSLTFTAALVPVALDFASIVMKYRVQGTGPWSEQVFAGLSDGDPIVVTGLTEETAYELLAVARDSGGDDSYPDALFTKATTSSALPAKSTLTDQLLDEVVTILGAVTQGSQYHNSLEVVEKLSGIGPLIQYEKRVLVYGDATEEFVESTNVIQRQKFPVVVEAHFIEHADVYARGESYIHDIKKALLADDTVNGLALNFECVGTGTYAGQEIEGSGIAFVKFLAQIRHVRTDPATVRC